MEELLYLKYVLAGLFILANAISDIKTKHIAAEPTIMFLATGLCINMIYSPQKWWFYLICLIPGIMMLVFSFISNEKIGFGDSLILLALGQFLELKGTFEMMFFGLIFASIFGTILILFLKKNKDAEIPFVPFLFLGYLTSFAFYYLNGGQVINEIIT